MLSKPRHGCTSARQQPTITAKGAIAITQKQKQQIINSAIHLALNEFENKNSGLVKMGRLRTCNATVYENERYIVLISYTTTVAFIDKQDRRAFDILRLVYGYTATSAQHIAKFFNDYARGYEQYRYYDI